MTPSEMHAEVLANLMWGPRKTSQLLEVTDCSAMSLNRWLEHLHGSGVIRISGEDDRPGPGRRERIWEMQTTPYAREDWNPRHREREASPESAEQMQAPASAITLQGS